MEQRLSLVTLGVASVPAARRFYEKLGWTASSASQGDEIVFFQLNGMALALFGRDALMADMALAVDATVPAAKPGFSGVTLAQNLRSPEAADELFARAVAAGAAVLKRPEPTHWGGYSGYFADPDGHVWELAHNPFFPLDQHGNLTLPA
jgi:uncharacterized glyoxalase superfamily protein PhnB